MPKASKSSASAGTRKKQAKKAGDDEEEAAAPQNRPQRGQKKLSKAQKKALPKVKQYIPPRKPPAPPIPDPLDGQGLARTLPAELVVVLRRLGKKDDVTRRKGLDELREDWVGQLLRPAGADEDEVERELKETALVTAVPAVWLHNLASLLQSPSHRTTALQLHNDFLSTSSVRASIIDTLSVSLLPGTQNRDLLGSWMVAALEEGKRSGGSGLKFWEESSTWSESSQDRAVNQRINMTARIPELAEYFSLSILDPSSLHDDIHPAPVASAPAPTPSPNRPGVKGAKARLTVTPAVATPSAEEEELAEERWARYRVGGLVGLGWLLQQLKKAMPASLSPEIAGLLRNPILWTALSSLDSPKLTLGTSQPPVRRAAYALLGTLIETYPEEILKDGMLNLLSAAVLENCWLEKEATVWETAGPSVVRFLSKYREAWQIVSSIESEKGPDSVDGDISDVAFNDHEEDDEIGDADANGDRQEDEDEDPRPNGVKDQLIRSTAFSNFLEFTSTTCPSIPHLTYPLLLVVISTMPTSLLPLEPEPSLPLKNLFSHLWSPVDARLLSTHALPGQPSAFQAFLRDVVDCTTFLISRSWKADAGKETALWLVKEEMGERIWSEGVLTMGGRAAGRRVRSPAGNEQEAETFGRAVSRVAGISEELIRELLPVIEKNMIEGCFPAVEAADKKAAALLPRCLAIIAAVREFNTGEPVLHGLDAIISKLAALFIDKLQEAVSAKSAAATVYAETVVECLRSHGTLVGEPAKQTLVRYLQSSATDLVDCLSPDLVISIFDVIAVDDVFRQTLRHLIESPAVAQDSRFALTRSLLASASLHRLAEGSLDSIAVDTTQAALAGGMSPAGAIAASCLTSKGHISSDALHTVLALVCTAIHDAVGNVLTGAAEATLPDEAFRILGAYAEDCMGDLVASDIYVQAIVAVHHLMYIVPRLRSGPPFDKNAVEAIWSRIGDLSETNQSVLADRISKKLAELLGQVTCCVDPSVIVDVALMHSMPSHPLIQADEVIRRILPPLPNIIDRVSRFASRPPDITLSIVDPLIPCIPEDTNITIHTSDFDIRGRSEPARYAEAIVCLLRVDRQLVNTQPELLQIALTAKTIAQDALAVPGASRGLFSTGFAAEHLSDLIRETDGALSYSLASRNEVQLDWHTSIIQQLRAGSPWASSDFLQRLLLALADGADNDVSVRIFRDVLSRHLRQSGAGEAEADAWLTYALSLIDRVPQLALAIILVVKPLLLDSKSFSTAQNRLANALTGIPVKQANTRGIPALRLVVASAPPPDAASVFLPQQRALFVLRHVSFWLTDDGADDLAEEIEYRVAELYNAVAPIVQDRSGAHWDSIFDLMESGLQNSSLDDIETYPLLHQSLLLLQQIRDLCDTNKALRSLWKGKDEQMKLVLKLFLRCRNAESTPLQLIQALLLDLLQDVSEDTVEDAGLPELCDLLRLSTSSAVQCTASRILSQVTRKRTLALVLEVEASISDAADGQITRTIALPDELVAIVEQGALLDWHSETTISPVLSQLFAWMAILDHFEDASRTLRWAYMDQLNSSKLLSGSLLPMLFAMLGVSEMGAWNFPASQYAVDEFFPDLLQPEDLPDLVPLASHVFYRSLVTIPSAMRTYYESLKDRQLSMSMLHFTARHLSPVIIAQEFSALRAPRAMAQFTEEGLNVRIAQGGGATAASGSGSAEAIASYVVDEQPMEIGIRLPAEFPLKGVDVRDLRRVGVPENKWRGWLMSVQQTITSRNGLILEALTVFKKNVALHFEGVVECAICYSIISLTDRTLPTKPCRTCKNRFHASCLFKWFNSSHSSSCPLCRTLF